MRARGVATMRKNIRVTIAAFAARTAQGRIGRDTCSTDGATLYSYRTAIATWEADGTLTIAADRSSTATTNGQIRAVRALLGDHERCVAHEECRLLPEMSRLCAADTRARRSAA